MNQSLTIKFKEVANVFNGKTPSTADQRKSGFPVLKIKDVDDEGNFSGTFDSFVDDSFALGFRDKCIQDGDVLILNAAHSADYVGSKIFFGSGSAIGALATGEWMIVRADSRKIVPRVLYFFLLSDRGRAHIKSLVRGIHLYPSDVETVQVPDLAFSEQEQVVRILDEADQLRRLRAEAGRHTADLVPALFHEMFGNPPKTWPVAKFGDLGTLDRGRSKHRPRDEANLFGGPYPFIQTGDIANSGGCVEAYTQTYSELGLSQSKLWPERTLCITIAANIAKCAVLSFPACFPDSVVGFIPNELIIVEFAQSWLETLQTKLEDEAPQAAQKNINLQTLRNLELRVPPVELQRTFAARVAEIRAMGAEQAASRRRLDDLFQSLLHRAFQGEL